MMDFQFSNRFKITFIFAALFFAGTSVAATANTQNWLPVPEDTADEVLYQSQFGPNHKLAHYVLFDERAPHVALYLTGGLMASNLTTNSNVVIDQYNTVNTYNTDMKWNFLLGAGVGVGYISYPYPFENFHMTIDPAFYYADFGTVSGIEHPDSSGGSFDTLNYQFKASSIALLFETHLAYAAYSWQPVVVLGIGGAGNYLNNYSEYASNPNGGASPTTTPFSNHWVANFAYEAGVGISHPIFVGKSRNVAYNLGLEYRYFNFGSGELGASASGNRLKVQTLDAQTILLSLGMRFS